MSDVDELQELTRSMDTSAFLRFLIAERFVGRTVATCSLRARSIVLMKLISEIDPGTPIVFCHMPEPYPETLAYRAELVEQLGLRDIRDPVADEGAPLPGDSNHNEGLWAENPIEHTHAYKYFRLNRTLAGFDCWISGVYHGPYPQAPAPRLSREGRLIRVNPLAGWSQDQVRRFMQDNGLRYHPRSALRPRESATEKAESVPTYHY